MVRPASSASASQGRKLSTRIAAFLRGTEDERRDNDDDDDLPRPNATISGLFPQFRFARPALA